MKNRTSEYRRELESSRKRVGHTRVVTRGLGYRSQHSYPRYPERVRGGRSGSVPVSQTVEPSRRWIWQPLLLLLHGSNVVGAVLPVNRANRCCRKVLSRPGYVIPRDSSRVDSLSGGAARV